MEIKILGNRALLEQVNFSVSFVNEDVRPEHFELRRHLVKNLYEDYVFNEETKDSDPLIAEKVYSTVCFCHLCKGKSYPGIVACCHSNDIAYRTGILIPPEFKNQISSDNKVFWTLKQKNTSGRLLLIRRDDNKVNLIIEQYSFCATMDSRDTITVEATPRFVTEINSDGTISCIENIEGEKKPASFEKALLIGASETKIKWDGARTAQEFVMRNMDVANRFGLSSVMCIEPDLSVQLIHEKLIQIYVYLYCKYPVVEQLIKADCKSVVKMMLFRVLKARNKACLKDVDKDFRALIDPNEKKASKAFNVPSFIIDYVKEVNGADALISLAKIHERTKFTKEMFESLIQTSLYRNFIVSSCFSDRPFEPYVLPWAALYLGQRLDRAWENLADIVIYGYENIEKLMRYLNKNRTEECETPYILLLDYLRSSSRLIPIEEIDLFPHNLQAAHDRATTACKIIEDEEHESLLKRIGETAEKAIDMDANWYKDSKYSVVFPKSTEDFVLEGNAQSNCVGGYPALVARGERIVFFIREKYDEDTSFVTADYRKGKLEQLCYRNNRYVDDEEIIEFASHIISNLRARFFKKGTDYILPEQN